MPVNLGLPNPSCAREPFYPVGINRYLYRKPESDYFALFCVLLIFLLWIHLSLKVYIYSAVKRQKSTTFKDNWSVLNIFDTVITSSCKTLHFVMYKYHFDIDENFKRIKTVMPSDKNLSDTVLFAKYQMHIWYSYTFRLIIIKS